LTTNGTKSNISQIPFKLCCCFWDFLRPVMVDFVTKVRGSSRFAVKIVAVRKFVIRWFVSATAPGKA